MEVRNRNKHCKALQQLKSNLVIVKRIPREITWIPSKSAIQLTQPWEFSVHHRIRWYTFRLTLHTFQVSQEFWKPKLMFSKIDFNSERSMSIHPSQKFIWIFFAALRLLVRTLEPSHECLMKSDFHLHIANFIYRIHSNLIHFLFIFVFS